MTVAATAVEPWSGNEMDTYAEDLSELIDTLDLTGAVLIGFSAGGGEVARYVGRHGTKHVTKAALISAVPPLILHGNDDQSVPIGAAALRSSKLVNKAKALEAAGRQGFDAPRITDRDDVYSPAQTLESAFAGRYRPRPGESGCNIGLSGRLIGNPGSIKEPRELKKRGPCVHEKSLVESCIHFDEEPEIVDVSDVSSKRGRVLDEIENAAVCDGDAVRWDRRVG